ncbi:MAG: hypothetical protein HQK49_09900 [Oligoflexia bacterium]|nr:hypothetical protein [Oligoflexia bacterium]
MSIYRYRFYVYFCCFIFFFAYIISVAIIAGLNPKDVPSKSAYAVDMSEPIEIINNDSKKCTFYLSKKIVFHEVLNYPTILLYYKDDDNKLHPRLLYKSHSSGVWRISPRDVDGDIGVDMTLDKGKYHYTQETKPHAKILEILEKNTKSIVKTKLDTEDSDILRKALGKVDNEIDNDVCTFLQLTSGDEGKNKIDNYEQQITKVNLPKKLKLVMDLKPGVAFSEKKETSMSEILSKIKFDDPSDFLPDFNLNPQKEYVGEHALLGAYKVSVFNSKLNGREIEWHMAKHTGCDLFYSKWENKKAPQECAKANVPQLIKMNNNEYYFCSDQKKLPQKINYEKTKSKELSISLKESINNHPDMDAIVIADSDLCDTVGVAKKDRVWIDQINFKDCNVNTFGMCKELIDSGVLTNKPLEYEMQSKKLINGKERIKTAHGTGNTHYYDITPVLSNLFPIKNFIKADKKREENTKTTLSLNKKKKDRIKRIMTDKKYSSTAYEDFSYQFQKGGGLKGLFNFGSLNSYKSKQ